MSEETMEEMLAKLGYSQHGISSNSRNGKCRVAQVMELLTPEQRQVVEMVLPNRSVTHIKLAEFLSDKSGVSTSSTTVRYHRHKNGCRVCRTSVYEEGGQQHER